jgi:hypothetical protein
MIMLGRVVFWLFGVPNLVSFVIVAAVGGLILHSIPPGKKSLVIGSVCFASGLISFFAALLIARISGPKLAFWLPLISAFWLAIHFLSRKRFVEFTQALSGVVTACLLHELWSAV